MRPMEGARTLKVTWSWRRHDNRTHSAAQACLTGRAALAVWVEQQHPLMAAHREPLAGNGLSVANALDKAISNDGVLMLACTPACLSGPMPILPLSPCMA